MCKFRHGKTQLFWNEVKFIFDLKYELWIHGIENKLSLWNVMSTFLKKEWQIIKAKQTTEISK